MRLIVLASAVLAVAVSQLIASQDLEDVAIVTAEEFFRGETTPEPPEGVTLLMPSASLAVSTTADRTQPADAVYVEGSERHITHERIMRSGASMLCAPQRRPEACSASQVESTTMDARV